MNADWYKKIHIISIIISKDYIDREDRYDDYEDTDIKEVRMNPYGEILSFSGSTHVRGISAEFDEYWSYEYCDYNALEDVVINIPAPIEEERRSI
jgi:hypothetical protein